MHIYLDDSKCREQLFPFTHTRNLADIRIGILTIREKWEWITGKKVAASPEERKLESTVIDAHIIPTTATAESIIKAAKDKTPILETEEIKMLHQPWQIFQYNEWALRRDFEMITSNRKSSPISVSNKCSGTEHIFIEEGAKVEHSFLNASAGPIYIGKNAEVMEGCMIRGPFALCDNAVLKMGSKIYGAVTIGPDCVAAGEIKNSVLMANSNKAHDGYLGDSVIGEWCNIGAGTTNSNVKNTAATVKMWHHSTNTYVPVGIKAGLIMGDYSRAAINTSFNTGTVAGICCNIFGAGFPPKYIPNFTWGSQPYIFEKAMQDINNWKQFKGQEITNKEIKILNNIYHQKL